MIHPSGNHSFLGETISRECAEAKASQWSVHNPLLIPPPGPCEMSGPYNKENLKAGVPDMTALRMMSDQRQGSIDICEWFAGVKIDYEHSCKCCWKTGGLPQEKDLRAAVEHYMGSMEGHRYIGCHSEWLRAEGIDAAFVNAPGYLYQHGQHVLHVDFIVAEKPLLVRTRSS